MLFSAYFLLVCIAMGLFACAQAGRSIVDRTGRDVPCNVETSIAIEQNDLLFDHPASSFTTVVQCPCFATHIRLACGSDWDQAFVNTANLTVLGDGVCLLLPGQVLAPNTSFTFLYEHSPPLRDIRAIDASFFNCTSIIQTSSSGHSNTPAKYTMSSTISFFLTMLLALR